MEHKGTAGNRPVGHDGGGDGVAAVLLAAGESARMGQPKQLIEWQGMPLIEYQIAQLCAVAEVGDVIVVVGHRAAEIVPLVVATPCFASGRVRVTLNPDYREGKTTSIKAGIAGIRSIPEAVLILAVDQPRPGEDLRRLVEEYLRQRPLISIPSYEGRRGHPPIFDASLVPEIVRISEARQGLLEVIERHRDAVLDVPMDSPLIVTNLNTPEDYQRARAMMESQPSSGRP